MTNTINEAPPILFAWNTSGIYSFPFNNSKVTRISEQHTSNLHCIEYDKIYLAYEHYEGNQTSYVLSTVNSTTLTTLVKQESVYPDIIDISVWNNSIAMLVSDANGTYVHIYGNDSDRRWNIQQSYRYTGAMMDVIPTSCTQSPIVHCIDGILATLHYDYTIPKTADTIVWSDTIIEYSVFHFVIGVSILVGIMGVGKVITRKGYEKRKWFMEHSGVLYKNRFV
jgi:hypothetical protein